MARADAVAAAGHVSGRSEEAPVPRALVRSAHADELEAQVQRATCCTAHSRCRRCRGKLAAVRAWRHDALVHSLSSSIARTRSRRPAW